MMMEVHSIFKSVSGEVGYFPQGSWVVFLRLAGCNLACAYCDTKITQDPESGFKVSVEDVAKRLEGFPRVVITGGEPMIQEEEVLELVRLLPDTEFQIETNGTFMPHKAIRSEGRVHWVVDYKCFGSEMTSAMPPYPDALYRFPKGSWLKFVITDRNDYIQAGTLVSKCTDEYQYAFSACPPLSHNTLFQWMMADGSSALFNVQIHKLARLNE